VDALRATLLGLAAANGKVLKAPIPEVQVTALGENTVTVQLQAWVAARDYNGVRAQLLEGALADFHRRGLRSAMPPREVHLHHHNAPDSVAGLPDEAIKPLIPRDA
jgi:small conductance mechanosensitive channel